MLRDEIKEQYKKLEGQGVKAHLAWFWEYYKIETVIAAGALFMIIGIIQAIVTNKPTALGVIFVNAYVPDGAISTEIAEGYAAYADISQKEYDVNMDLQESLSLTGTSSEYEMGTVQKIVAESAAKELDVMVCNAFHFQSYVYGSMFSDLREIMTDEQIASYGDRVYYVDLKAVDAYNEAIDKLDYESLPSVTDPEAWQSIDEFERPDPSQMEEPVPVGIIVNDAPLIENNQFYPGTVCVFGFVAASERQENAAKFLEYMYQD